ncbi:MAG: hypothetical protein COA78_36435 [Blastopirellula sp.]|nr:MAG: hypothetical protein COA78_36435 [Blastopirellula sp.]
MSKRIFGEVSDSELKDAFENCNFGGKDPRDVVENAVLKKATGYHNGSTSEAIIKHLGLVKKNGKRLTKHGQRFLFNTYSRLREEAKREPVT